MKTLLITYFFVVRRLESKTENKILPLVYLPLIATVSTPGLSTGAMEQNLKGGYNLKLFYT